MEVMEFHHHNYLIRACSKKSLGGGRQQATGNRQQATVSSLIFYIIFTIKNGSCKVFKSQTPISLHFFGSKQPLCIDKSMFDSYSADPN